MTTNSETVRGTRKIALTNVRVFDGQLIREPSTVVIDGELIGTDSEGAEVIDGNGGVLLPGLIDAHVHLENEDSLRQLSKFGVTTGLDMATWPQSKLNNLRNRVGMTDIRSPGVPATSPGSIHSCLLPIPTDELVANPEDAKNYIAKRIAEGVDYIKVVCDVPGPDQATLNVLVTEAHKHKKLVIAHAAAFHPFAMAQDAGADVITHAPRDKALDDEAASRMATAFQSHRAGALY
jgi:imidazolonepropionase-like amidohydrolase